MSKDGWQATALFAIALLILTNAVQFYTRRVEAVERTIQIPAAKCTEPAASIIEYRSVRAIPNPPINDPDIRCIGNVPMKRKNGTWEQVPGQCN